MDQSLTYPAEFGSFLPTEVPHSFRLEALQKSDESAIVDILRRTLLSIPDEGEVLASTLRRLPCFHRSYSDPGASYVVIKDYAARTLLGGIGVRPFAGLDPSEGIAEIRELVIDIPFRGLGLGKKLIEVGILMAKKLGYRRVYLEVSSQMDHAQAIFNCFGFRPIDGSMFGSAGSQSTTRYFLLEDL